MSIFYSFHKLVYQILPVYHKLTRQDLFPTLRDHDEQTYHWVSSLAAPVLSTLYVFKPIFVSPKRSKTSKTQDCFPSKLASGIVAKCCNTHNWVNPTLRKGGSLRDRNVNDMHGASLKSTDSVSRNKIFDFRSSWQKRKACIDFVMCS